MAFRPRTPRSNPLDLPPVPLDRLVQLFVVALLDQMGENLQHTPYATVEGKLRDREVTPAQSRRRERRGGMEADLSLRTWVISQAFPHLECPRSVNPYKDGV
jgi:hypothetical protein